MTRRVVIAAVAAVVLIAVWLVAQPYISKDTRLTEVPPLVTAVSIPLDEPLPRPAHVVIVVEENKSDSTIIGNSRAPYLKQLAKTGASFSHASGVAHLSQPNYLGPIHRPNECRR